MKKGKYVDGFVLPVKKNKLAVYRKMAKWGEKLWKKHGALDYKECWADDLRTSFGMPYPKQLKLRKGETVVFSYIVYKSRKHRDEVNRKVMKDPVMNDPKNKNMEMPFDVKRMCYGGFKIIVGA